MVGQVDGVKALRIVLGGVAAAAAWGGGIAVVFGPAQVILASPAHQSAKFLSAFAEAPLPRMADSAATLPVGLFLIGLIHSTVYAWLAPRLPGGALRRGLAFGAIAWALMVPWFEFYLPYNVMLEPFPLVLLEALCWLGVMLMVGLAVAGTHRLLTRSAKTSSAA